MKIKLLKPKFAWISLFLLCVIAIGCAQVTSLNLQKHQFGKVPTKIVWIQVAGLSEEHLALLRYSYPTADLKTAFEKSLCLGKAWEYNLYSVRPDPASGFMSQMTGQKNVKNSCEDFELRPIWSYMLAKGYKAGVFEGESTSAHSILRARNECSNQDFLNGLHIWKMDEKAPKDAKFFHVEETPQFRPNEIYYDRSCLSGDCFSTFSANVVHAFESFSRNTENYLFMVRNFEYEKNLREQKPAQAKEQLVQLDKLVDYFQQLAAKRSDFLLLVTSSAARDIQFPEEGADWTAYERTGANFSAQRSDLISSVFVNGARAENFCGLYEQSEILSRIFSGAKQQGLELTIINPFKD